MIKINFFESSYSKNFKKTIFSEKDKHAMEVLGVNRRGKMARYSKKI